MATGLGGLNSQTVNLTVLADNDGDGAADLWEALYGMNTNNAADALLDPDGDRMMQSRRIRSGNRSRRMPRAC